MRRRPLHKLLLPGQGDEAAGGHHGVPGGGRVDKGGSVVVLQAGATLESDTGIIFKKDFVGIREIQFFF